MRKNLFVALTMALLAGSAAQAADYGLPSGIQDGNILHCFNWTAKEVKADLANIAAAGFGSVQLSPCQRPDIRTGSSWHDLYRPYDLAFKSSNYCTEQDLKDLCSEAAKYGIKVIIDVVANHVDKTSGYHDPWWDTNGHVRWEGGINYGSRYSITHGQLGDYGDINSENSEVIARAKAYVEQLKSYGVKGIRWDAAKHIALPSEGCNFWSTVTSVSGMYHYGEILNDDGTPITEYAKYMSVTDNRYSNSAAKNNGGVQQGYGGEWAVNRGVAANKLVYWGESHDTYSNDEWSQNVDQSVIDRAYACVATRNGATALYLARPNTKGFNNIKVGKGSTAYRSTSIAAVNQLRNKAGSAADYCSNTSDAFCCTRQGIGAVIVKKGSGNVSVQNGGSYCPAGTYKDLVSGSTFTVTNSTISGNVGSTGIAVIIKDGVAPTPNPNPDPDPTPGPTPTVSELYILGNLANGAGWSTTPGTGVKMTGGNNVFTAKGVTFELAANETKCYFNLTDYVASTWDALNSGANRYGAATEGETITLGTAATIVEYPCNVTAMGCLSWTVAPGTYDITADLNTMKLTVVNAGDTPNPNPDPTPTPSGSHTVYFDNSSSNWSTVNCYTWTSGASDQNAAWPGVAMTSIGNNIYSYTLDAAPANVIFNNGSDQTSDLDWVDGDIYKADGSHTSYTPNPSPNPDPTPGPTPAASMWILGNLANGAGWGSTPGTGVGMVANGNVYTAENVTFELVSGESVCYFNITDYVASTWDALNSGANRYGAATEGEAVTLGTPASIVEYPCNVTAMGCLSWTIAPGTYKVVADLNTKQLTVTKASGVEDIEAADEDAEAVYYNLQGVEVADPTPGIYIVRKGAKVYKTVVR